MYKKYNLTVQLKIFGIIKTFIRKRPGMLFEKQRYSFAAKNDEEAEQKAQEIMVRNKKRTEAEITRTIAKKGVFLWEGFEAEIHECFFVEAEKTDMYQALDFSQESVKTALENLTIEQFKEMYGTNCLEAICEQ